MQPPLQQLAPPSFIAVSRSTVGRVLGRAGLSRLKDLEPSEPVVRYEHAHPGDLIHIDTKKLGRIVLAGIAKFERALIRERQREGIEIAKHAGKYKGRKKSFNGAQAQEVRGAAARRVPKAELARTHVVSRQTIHKYLRK